MKNIISKILVVIICLWILASVIIPFLTEDLITSYYLITYTVFGILCMILLIILIVERKKEKKEENKNDISNY